MDGLPDEFFRLVEEIEHVSGNDFIIRARPGCTYYTVGWLISKHWDVFTNMCPGLELRSRTERQRGIDLKDSRFWKDNRS